MEIIDGIARARQQIMDVDWRDPTTVCLNVSDYQELRKEIGEIFTIPGGSCVRIMGLNIVVDPSLNQGEMKIF